MNASSSKEKALNQVPCHRCGGLMVPEHETATGIEERRCVSCGERVDPVILQHRQVRDVRSEAERGFAASGTKHLN